MDTTDTIVRRVRQAINNSKSRGIAVPSFDKLSGMFAALGESPKCPVCERGMSLSLADGTKTKGEARTSVVTVQHDRDGGFRLICFGCNLKHWTHDGDTFYKHGAGYRRCAYCGNVKPIAEFIREHKDGREVREQYCSPCMTTWARDRGRVVRAKRKARRMGLCERCGVSASCGAKGQGRKGILGPCQNFLKISVDNAEYNA